MNDVDLAAPKNSLAKIAKIVESLRAEMRVLESRRDTLDRDVGFAKGRLLLKPKVDTFLEELQAEAHARRVGDFEKLLTALVLEVLPGEKPIGLDLEIERGQPSLDIVSRITADWSEDIYEDQGGALTNIVVLGLRMIAVVRSGMRKFLVLDEADCWVKGERVPSFYRVVKEAARKIGVQCFIISHHDIANFDEGMNVASLRGNPELPQGVVVENGPRPHVWTAGEDGIRYIRLRNFQGYVDQTVHFAPGVNGLTGDNNIGKSSFVRALRAVFYGETRDTLIRRGETRCEVQVGLPGGRVLHWDRQSRRNPVNVWKLLGEDGAVISENGMTYETGGRTAPAWVADVAGIGPLEGLDIHVTKQKSPVFLLDKPGSTRAAVLSIGQESGHIRKMITLHKEACAADSASVKNGEKEMNMIVSRMNELAVLGEVEAAVARCGTILAQIEQRSEDAKLLKAALSNMGDIAEKLQSASRKAKHLTLVPDTNKFHQMQASVTRELKMTEIATQLRDASSGLYRASALKGALQQLPGFPELRDERLLTDAVRRIGEASDNLAIARATKDAVRDLPGVMPVIDRNDERIRAGKALKEARIALSKASAAKAAFSTLPLAMPIVSHDTELERSADGLKGAAAALAAARQAKAKAAENLTSCRAELDGLVEAMGHVCPLCNHEIEDAAAFIGSHIHSEGTRHA